MVPSWLRKAVLPSGKSVKHRRRKRSSPLILEQLGSRLVPTKLFIPQGPAMDLTTSFPMSVPAGGSVTVPVMVDTLDDSAANGNLGLVGAALVVLYDPNIFTVSANDVNLGTMNTGGSTAPGDGYAPATAANPNANNGWSVSVPSPPTTPGLLDIQLINDGTGTLVGGATGSLVTITFHISPNLNPPFPQTEPIDLAADTGDGDPISGTPPSDTTQLVDQFFSNFTLNPPPLNNATLTPNTSGPPTYTYTPSDPDDGIITVTAPVAHFLIQAPTFVSVNGPFAFTVKALDANQNVNTGYTGIVTFSSTDTGSSTVLPPASGLINGVGIFTATLSTPGNQQIFGTDASNGLQGV